MSGDNLVYLYKVTPQEEIFCQNYVTSVDTIFSAYHAGMASNIKFDVKFEDLNQRQRSTLSKAGCRALDKQHVKKRISEISRIESEKNACMSLQEILNYLSTVVRKSKNNISNAEYQKNDNIINTDLIKGAINAISVLIKRYPDFADGEQREDIVFKRGS
jgi:meiotically up-regulated gene 157 (Mug157) protein